MENWTHLDVARVLRETEKAFLLLLESGEELWVPKSVVSEPDDYEEGDGACTVSVRDWWAEQRGIAKS